MKLSSFRDVMMDYKVIFLDAFGVIKNADGLIPGVIESVSEMKSLGKDIYILTNDASKSPTSLLDNYVKMGLDMFGVKDIISSGMMAMNFLGNKIKAGRVVYIGTKESSYYVDLPNFDFVSISDLDLAHIDDIAALIFLDDEGFNWDKDLNKCINLLRMKSFPIIVANSDNTYPVSKTTVNLANGAIARMLESVSQKSFIYFGKPDSQMFMLGYKKAQKKDYVKRPDILMVGDTLSTDIMGGNKFGCSTALVLSGNSTEDGIRSHMESSGIIPDFICESIAFKASKVKP